MDIISDPNFENPKPTDFEKFLPWACRSYDVVHDIIVTKVSQGIYERGSSSKSKQSRKLRQSRKVIRSNDSIYDKESLSEPQVNCENTINVQTLYDTNEDLVHLKFLKNKTIPQIVMKVIALTIPYHKHLTSITIHSGLHMETLYEMSNFIPDSNITELCLDSTFLSKANYYMLLTYGKLKHLSLARCSINDVVVKTITDQLGATKPASRVLSALNLSSNRITDVGAKYVAGMLRTNRKLSYLSLADNKITDEGGMSILDTLQKFPLEFQECLESRARYVDYLKKKNEFIAKMIIELQTAKDIIPKKKGGWKSKQESRKHLLDPVADARLIHEKAVEMAETEMPSFDDPFSPDNSESQDGVVRCFGNNTLCCLNFAYNNLSYVSVRKLLEVLLTQKSLNRTPKGLIKVVIEGNLMPAACEEYDEIQRLLNTRSFGIRKLRETTKRIA